MTDKGIELAAGPAWPRRGGFWRRFLALIIDYLVVLLPLYFLAAGLFLLTDGGVKGHFWLVTICRSAKPHGSPSPERYNWQVCSSSHFAPTVADWAVGTTKEVQSGKTETVSIGFRPLGLDLLLLPVLAIYLFVMEATCGRSVGKRALVLVVYDKDDWQRRGLPWQKAFRRQGIKFLGTLPFIVTKAWFAFRTWGSAPGPATSYSWLEVATAAVALGFALVWPVWIGISIALGHEPIHDRVAGTTVRTRETHE